MDSVLQLTPEQRNELFVSLTQKIGFTSEILEKDAGNVFPRAASV